jgi:hypothetical protein
LQHLKAILSKVAHDGYQETLNDHVVCFNGLCKLVDWLGMQEEVAEFTKEQVLMRFREKMENTQFELQQLPDPASRLDLLQSTSKYAILIADEYLQKFGVIIPRHWNVPRMIVTEVSAYFKSGVIQLRSTLTDGEGEGAMLKCREYVPDLPADSAGDSAQGAGGEKEESTSKPGLRRMSSYTKKPSVQPPTPPRASKAAAAAAASAQKKAAADKAAADLSSARSLSAQSVFSALATALKLEADLKIKIGDGDTMIAVSKKKGDKSSDNNDSASGAGGGKALPPKHWTSGLFSGALLPLLFIYVRTERDALEAMLANLAKKDDPASRAMNGGVKLETTGYVMNSANRLLQHFQSVIKRASFLDQGKTMLDLFKLTRQALSIYARGLSVMTERATSLSELCAMLATADHLLQQVPYVCDIFCKHMLPELHAQVTLEEVKMALAHWLTSPMHSLTHSLPCHRRWRSVFRTPRRSCTKGLSSRLPRATAMLSTHSEHCPSRSPRSTRSPFQKPPQAGAHRLVGLVL